MPSERNYYVICDDNCRFEGMTKEQIYDAIASATGQTPTPVDQAFITKIKDQNRGVNLKYWVGTEAEYNALTEKDATTVYIVTDATTEFDFLQRQINELPSHYVEIPVFKELPLELPENYEGDATAYLYDIAGEDDVGNPIWITHVQIVISGYATDNDIDAVFHFLGGATSRYGNGKLSVTGDSQFAVYGESIRCATLINDELTILNEDNDPVNIRYDDDDPESHPHTIIVSGMVTRARN